MKEIKGDIFAQHDADAICVTTNGVVKANGELVMGAGVAKQFAIRFPKLPYAFGQLNICGGNHVYRVPEYSPGTSADLKMKESKTPYICSFPTKHHWKDASDLKLIKRSAEELKGWADTMGWTKVVLTRPGCGLGGLQWSQVKAVLEPILDDRFYIITPEVK